MLFATFTPMQHRNKLITGALVITGFVALFAFEDKVNRSTDDSPFFSPGINQKIQDAFLDVWQHYSSLHRYGFEVIQKQLGSSTMEARPVIDFSQVFGNKRGYRLNVAEKVLDSGELDVADLPKEVLRGWFAHELGHMVDYEKHSNLEMIGFGIKYLVSDKFKREREHEADSIAIRHGFKQEIIAAKKYILENDFISPTYQNQIKKYYMSIQGAELCPEERKQALPKLEL